MRVAAMALALVVSFNVVAAEEPARARQASVDLPIAPAFLRAQLPQNIVAYARIPNLLGLFAMPKNGQLDAAQRSDANLRNVRAVQLAMVQNVLSLPGLDDPRLRFLVDSARSPVEVAAYGLPNPAVLVGVKVAARTRAEFNALFDGLGTAAPPVRLAAPLDDQGIGQLSGLPLAAFVKFDAATGRMLLFAAPRLDRAEFEQYLGNLPVETKDHPMYALERKIDSSGQGLFVWADAAQLVPMTQMASPGLPQALQSLGLGGMRAVAFGFGTANGKGRMSFMIDAGTDHTKRPFPVVANTVKATAVGNPDAVALVSLPSKVEFTRLESMVLATLSPASRGNWDKAKSGFREKLGIDIEEIFAAVGPDVIMLFDTAGDYTAIHLRDPALFDDIVRRIAAKTGAAPEERVIGGATLHHWRLPTMFGAATSARPTPVPAPGPAPAPAPTPASAPTPGASLLALFGRLRSHVYWIRDGEYLYMAATPQALMDRVAAGATTRVDTWLANRQRIDMSTSLFAATASVPKMPRRTYESYIGMLQNLSDLTNAKVDLWSMPTARQLGLPDKGTVGIALNLGEPYLSLELTYESHPAEGLLAGGGVGTFAVVGIAAAIAIPAYQDYTIRAQVTEGLGLATSVKDAVASSYTKSGALPRDRRAAGLAPAADATDAKYVDTVDVAGGVIKITFGKAANNKLKGRTLTLTPYATTGRDIGWRCGYAKAPEGTRALVPEDATAPSGTTIEPKYLPTGCR